MRYFFDTYALVEITKNNPNYLKYSDEVIVTSIFNLVELYYVISRDFDEEKARLIYSRFKECVIGINDDAIFSAINLKLKNKSLSYTDCIGYCLAMANNLLFLTGDREFKIMKNVEFIM